MGRRALEWWVLQIQTNGRVVKIYLAPVWRYPSIDISPGDEVEVKVFQPPLLKRLYGGEVFRACSLTDKTNGKSYLLRRYCPNF